MESDESVDLRLGSSEMMNKKSFAQALAHENQQYLSAVVGILENKEHTPTLARPESYTLFTPTGPLQQSKPNAFLISEFPDPLSSRPFTRERLHEGQRSRICGMTRIYSFSSMTHPRPPEIRWLWRRIWELFPAPMRACQVYCVEGHTFLGSRCLGVKSLSHILVQLLLNTYGVTSPENITFILRGNTNLAFLIKLLKDKITQYV